MKFHNKVYFAKELLMHKITIMYLNAKKLENLAGFPYGTVRNDYK